MQNLVWDTKEYWNQLENFGRGPDPGKDQNFVSGTGTL